MEITSIFSQKLANRIPGENIAGIDIGSRQSKAVLFAAGELYTVLVPTGVFMQETAQDLLDDLLRQSGLQFGQLDYIVATGYGRVSLSFKEVPFQMVTEISCHGLGASFLGDGVKTVIDIGGQDSKVIRIDPESGKVLDFAMNDKCAAGTGRFLEKTANILACSLEELGTLSLEATEISQISSTCVVFAESEIISARARGESSQNLAAGVHLSVAGRVHGLLNRVGIEAPVLFTGGVSNNVGMVKALEQILGFKVQTSKLNPVFAGALGAALFAGQFVVKEIEERKSSVQPALNLDDITAAAQKSLNSFADKSADGMFRTAYFCLYTPPELLSAAGTVHTRFIHAGTGSEIQAGKQVTQSTFCDFTRGSLGSFQENNPVFAAIDSLFTFSTCNCAVAAAKAINHLYKPAKIYSLPSQTDAPASLLNYGSELRELAVNLEELTRKKPEAATIRQYIKLYNRARGLLRQISSFRKQDFPIISGSQFQQLARSYFFVPVEELIPQLEDILTQLKTLTELRPNQPQPEKRPLRLMLISGIIADGDAALIDALERSAAIVIEDSCTGYRAFSQDISETDGDVFEDLAKGYLSQIPCPRMRPFERHLEFSAALAVEYHIDGIVYYALKDCTCYGVARYEYIERFRALNIPIIEIDGDYSGEVSGQIKTRIEAFFELLNKRSTDGNG